MQPELAEEIQMADAETLEKFHKLLDRLRHLQPSADVQRKLLRGLLNRQQDEAWPIPGR
jgi:hypothetical protein